jgi:hypothetical protein
MIDYTRWSNVDEMHGSVKGFDPKLRWKMTLDKECADDIVDSSEHALGFSVLGRGVRAGKAE